MPDSPFRERRVPPDELQRILRRAAELALIDPSAAFAGSALTTAEIERRLKALGLSDDVVGRAMQAPEISIATASDGATRVEREAQVQGMLAPQGFEQIAELIASKMGMAGRTSAVGNKLTWTPAGMLLEPAVTVHAKNGRTTIHYIETLAPAHQATIGFGVVSAFAAVAAAFISALVAISVTQAAHVAKASGAPVVLGIALVVAIGVAIATFVGLKRRVARRTVQRAAFADELVALLEQAVNANVVEAPLRSRLDAPPTKAAAVEEREAEASAEATEVEAVHERERAR